MIWKSESVSSNDANKELNDNFEIVDNFKTEENVISHFKNEFIPKKIESHLTNFSIYDLETHNQDRGGSRPYCISFYILSKLSSRYNRDLTPYELEKCTKGTINFDGDNCIETALDFCIKLKGEERKVKKSVEYNLQFHAYNGSGFDTWVVINILPCDKRIFDIVKNGKGIIELKVLNGYIGNKRTPQNIHFRCGMTHLKYFLKKIGKTFELQKELLKTEMNHDEIDGNNYKDKKDEWFPHVEIDVLCTALCYSRYIKSMEELTGFSMKDCLSIPRLGFKCFNRLRTEGDEPIYTYNDKYMR